MTLSYASSLQIVVRGQLNLYRLRRPYLHCRCERQGRASSEARRALSLAPERDYELGSQKLPWQQRSGVSMQLSSQGPAAMQRSSALQSASLLQLSINTH